MKLHFLLLLLPVLHGCTSTAPKQAQEPEKAPEIQALAWLESADAEADAERAIVEQNFRLKAIAGRGMMIPGIETGDKNQAKHKCGIDYMKGMGDAIKGDEHRKWWKKGQAYAKAYNTIVAKFCLHKGEPCD